MHKNWLQFNFAEKLINPNTDFKIYCNFYNYNKLSFHDAAKKTILQIADRYNNIHLALSGGIDSEYILYRMYELKVPFKVVIVQTPMNLIEWQYAFYNCRQLNIEPIILRYSKEHYLKKAYELVHKKLKCSNYHGVTPLLISQDIKDANVLIGSSHVIGMIAQHKNEEYEYGFGNANPDIVEFYEPDFYLDAIEPEKHPNSFFAYNLDIVAATILDFDTTLPIQEAKSKFYNRPFRPKIRWGEYTTNLFFEKLGAKYNYSHFCAFDKTDFLKSLVKFQIC